MSYRTGCYRKTRGLRVRPVPEVGCCYIYTPARPRMHSLNMTAWLVLELCEGRSRRMLAQAYEDEMENAYWCSVGRDFFIASPPPSRIALRRELRLTLGALEARGIIELTRPTRGTRHGKKP